MEIVAQILLALFLLCGLVIAFSRHDKVVNSHRFNALPFVIGLTFEVVLIWMAGGWG